MRRHVAHVNIRRRVSGIIALLAVLRMPLSGVLPCSPTMLTSASMGDMRGAAVATPAVQHQHERSCDGSGAAPCQPQHHTDCVAMSGCTAVIATLTWPARQPRLAAATVSTALAGQPLQLARAPEPPPPRA